MSIEKNNINPGILDKKKLLNELANDIANKFGIDKEKAEKLIRSKTLVSLDSLKDELKNELDKEGLKEKKLSDKQVEDLFFTLRGALDIIENFSKVEIKTLKEDVEKSINIEEFKNHIEDYLPPKLLEKAKNPKNINDNILGFALGTTNSIIATVDILYQIGKGILQSPYHLYMIITGKAKTDSFKNI